MRWKTWHELSCGLCPAKAVGRAYDPTFRIDWKAGQRSATVWTHATIVRFGVCILVLKHRQEPSWVASWGFTLAGTDVERGLAQRPGGESQGDGQGSLIAAPQELEYFIDARYSECFYLVSQPQIWNLRGSDADLLKVVLNLTIINKSTVAV